MVKDRLSQAHRSWNMSRIQNKNTTPELVVRRCLHQMGYRFRLHRKDLPGRPDIVMPKFKTVVLVHGCFWHRHRGCSNCTTPSANRKFWLKKFQDNMNRDQKNRRALKKSGWRVLVIWECQTEDVEKLRRRLTRLMDSIQTVASPESNRRKCPN